MRCTIVLSDLGPGGTQRLALGLVLHLRERGLDVNVLTLDAPGADSFFPVPDGVGVTGLNLSAPSANFFGALRANLTRMRILRSAFARIRPDLVLSFLCSNNVLTLLAARPLGIPVIVAEESDPGHEPIPRVWALMRRLTYTMARHIVVHSRGAAAFFRRGTAHLVRVIPNPVGPCPAAPKLNTLTQPRLPQVIAMGRLSPEKGFDLLLAAFALIAPRHLDWSLVILGDGPLRPDLERQVASLGLADRVVLPGYSRVPAEMLCQASIFCSAARIEGFGLALCEAMACGLPVIATDAPSGPREIVRPGVDGDLVPVDDPAALAAALSALMADSARRRAYGARAFEVIERFSPARVWAAWDVLIDHDARQGQ